MTLSAADATSAIAIAVVVVHEAPRVVSYMPVGGIPLGPIRSVKLAVPALWVTATKGSTKVTVRALVIVVVRVVRTLKGYKVAPKKGVTDKKGVISLLIAVTGRCVDWGCDES